MQTYYCCLGALKGTLGQAPLTLAIAPALLFIVSVPLSHWHEALLRSVHSTCALSRKVACNLMLRIRIGEIFIRHESQRRHCPLVDNHSDSPSPISWNSCFVVSSVDAVI